MIALADTVTWAVDVPDGGAALLIGLLVARGPGVALYLWACREPGRRWVPGRGQDRRAGRPDHRRPARMRHDLQPLPAGDEITAELKILTGRRADLTRDRIRDVNRLRGLLTVIFPALERAST